MPVFDMLETVLVIKCRLRPGFMLRFVARSLYVGKSDRAFLLAYFSYNALNILCSFDSVCSVYNGRRDSRSLLWWVTRIPWGLCVCPSKLLCKPHISYPFALICAPTTAFDIPKHSQLPCIMWLSVYKPKRFSLSWMTNWVSYLISGLTISVMCT